MKSVKNELMQKEISVYTTTVKDFFDVPIGKDISLPPYQRPYVWNFEKIDQLFQDWVEHFFEMSEGRYNYKEDAPLYYIGTTLIYKTLQPEEKYEVIDGQQRITSLLILNHRIKRSDSYLSQNQWNLSYNSKLSSANIKRNFIDFQKHKFFSLIKDYLDGIYQKLIFSVVITNCQDDAFTFFDSQNSRGVSLDAVDFLKSYHLRELKGKEREQKIFVKKWDYSNADQFLNYLFEKSLWRARNWKGKSLQFENKDHILNSFQKKTKKGDGITIKLYANSNNQFASSLSFSVEEGIKMSVEPLYFQLSADKYPFGIRQPIEKGSGFFLYTEKYYSLYKRLFEDQSISCVVDVMKGLIKDYNLYFTQFFKLLVIVYYDKYREERLLDFMLWVDYLLGAFRVKQATIVSQTPIKILRDQSQNLIDVIEQSYDPEEIFDFITDYIIDGESINNWYKQDLENYGSVNGIRNQYRKTVLNYYGKEAIIVLTNKKEWINGQLSN